MPNHRPFVEDLRVSSIVLQAWSPAQTHRACNCKCTLIIIPVTQHNKLSHNYDTNGIGTI